ncbi:MAG TPA: ABC transporter permease [Planctomycetota bacterium]|nr:ABC transporter permease [Planctomycetota bacterium]
MGFIARIFGILGRMAIMWADELGQMGRLVQRTLFSLPRMRPEPTAVQMLRFGIRAVPIISMVNLFVGMIVAVSMSSTLENFNAINRTAEICAVAVTRELGPLMTGLTMSGFAGAAIAAEIASMNVNEEILALEAGALSPIRFLVLPRVIGVMTMMMCLTLVADVMGMFGGFIVGTNLLNISPLQYIDINNKAVEWPDIPKGLIKAAAYGMIITIVACRQGLSAHGGALGVGRATTTAVVRSIVCIIAAALCFSILFHWAMTGK